MMRTQRPRSLSPRRVPGAGALALALLVVRGVAAQADAPVAGREGSAAAPSSPPADRSQWIGALSVGHPHAGYLFNAARMPAGSQWVVSIPDHAYGTEETIAALIHCIGRVNEQHPDSPKAIIGSISAEHGGHLPPHKSHRTGRDVDVHFYLTQRKPKTWYETATAENLDRPRTWALLRALITEADVEMVLIDQAVQDLLEAYALEVGEDAVWVAEIFHGRPGRSSIVKHVPGHTGHMHIRFVSPVARRRGRDAYRQLVEQGHIQLPAKELVHEVAPGDTLLRLAQKYDTSVEVIQQNNELDSTVIRVGQKLRIRERVELRGALDPVVVPPRRLPPAVARTLAGR